MLDDCHFEDCRAGFSGTFISFGPSSLCVFNELLQNLALFGMQTEIQMCFLWRCLNYFVLNRCKVLETCVKNCGYRFHILVTTREFVEGVLVRAIIPRNNPPLVVHDRVLSIVQVQEVCMD